MGYLLPAGNRIGGAGPGLAAGAWRWRQIIGVAGPALSS
jgi:hypothetical protein